jgi:hypothetical protein
MSETESESADVDTDAAESENDDEFVYYPQVTQHPTTIIEGEIVDIVTKEVDGSKETTDNSFGVVFEDPEVTAGTIWQSDAIPEGFTSTSEFNDELRIAVEGTDNDYVRVHEVTEDRVEEARERLSDAVDVDDWGDAEYDDLRVGATDYKVADEDDDESNVSYDQNGDTEGIDVSGGVFDSEKTDEFDADRIMVWYGGMSGQRIGRALDFNGMPFARFTDPDEGDQPYLVKGLFQAPIGWRGDADVEQFEDVPTTDRSELARSESRGGLGRPPRVVRPALLRDDIDGRSFIALGRYNGGQMYETHVGRALDDYDEFTETLLDDEDVDDLYDEIGLKYDQDADERLAAEFDNPKEVFGLYHGEGWQDEPENVDWGISGSGSEGGSFDTPDVEVDDDAVEHPTEQEVAFAEGVAEKIAGTGASPDDEIFPISDDESVGLEGLVDHNSDSFQVDPDLDAIREVVYENTGHLDASDL